MGKQGRSARGRLSYARIHLVALCIDTHGSNYKLYKSYIASVGPLADSCTSRQIKKPLELDRQNKRCLKWMLIVERCLEKTEEDGSDVHVPIKLYDEKRRKR